MWTVSSSYISGPLVLMSLATSWQNQPLVQDTKEELVMVVTHKSGVYKLFP